MGRPRGTQNSNEVEAADRDLPPPEDDLSLFSGFYWDFTAMVRALVELMPPRTTARQAYAFLLIVRQNALGHSVTAKGLRELAGRDGNHEEILGQTIQRTYQLFLAPDEHNPEGLDWVYVETDPQDRRQNFLRLTPKGLSIVRKIRTSYR